MKKKSTSKLSIQTKSFLTLLTFCVLGTFVVVLWFNYVTIVTNNFAYTDNTPLYTKILHKAAQKNTKEQPTVLAANTIDPSIKPTSDISDWKTYSNQELKLSFKYKTDWEILPTKIVEDYTVITIDPGKKYFNMFVTVSKKGYYGLDSVASLEQTIAGHTAKNAGNQIIGFKIGENYYTFWVNKSLSLIPDFLALVNSVKFE